jgi:hypothetical protein
VLSCKAKQFLCLIKLEAKIYYFCNDVESAGDHPRNQPAMTL